MKKQKRKYFRRDDGVELAEALRRQPSLSAFSFDGPYDATRSTCWITHTA